MNNAILAAIIFLHISIIILCLVVFIIKIKRESKISSYRKKRSQFRVIKEENDEL
jgi:hypothetical protein